MLITGQLSVATISLFVSLFPRATALLSHVYENHQKYVKLNFSTLQITYINYNLKGNKNSYCLSAVSNPVRMSWT